MKFQAVGNRCAVHVPSLDLPIADDQALLLLEGLGYRQIEVDTVALARERIGKATYRRGARMREAPDVFDCSSFMKWLYGRRGIWLPRYSIQQYEDCHLLPSGNFLAGDLVFSAGFRPYYRSHPAAGVGHVGIVTNDLTVVHAANSEEGVVEEPLAEWQQWVGFRGVRRRLPSGLPIITLECPPDAEVECSDDIRWKILQRLPA